MIYHNFKYTLKTLFKNKMLIFWTYFFPLLLGTMFYFAFNDLENNQKLKVINIGIVNNQQFNENAIYKETFKNLSDGEDKLFNIKYQTLEECNDLLDKKEIDSYLVLESEPKIVISNNGINATILKFVVDEINNKNNLLKNISEISLKENNGIIDYQTFYKSIYNEILSKNINIKDNSNSNMSYTMIEYYTLIAMTCLYGATIGMYAINSKLANMSSNGKRVSISPIKKLNMIIGTSMASFVVQIIGVLMLFFYTILVLNVDYGNNFYGVLLMIFIGSLAGLSFGIGISSSIKTNENLKIGLIIAITMFFSFLSGMMGITMKYVIDKNIPIVNQLNPASMITDGFYNLYYYQDINKFMLNIISLIVFSSIMLSISIISLRREKYDSI